MDNNGQFGFTKKSEKGGCSTLYFDKDSLKNKRAFRTKFTFIIEIGRVPFAVDIYYLELCSP
jgi:hypothetical protein